MLRIATLLLCLLLAAASAGRYRAEVAVQETRKDIERLQREQEDEKRRIQVLRAELAFLESPDRLANIAEEQSDLQPLSGRQFYSTSEFIAILTGTSPKNSSSDSLANHPIAGVVFAGGLAGDLGRQRQN